jgi:hypothetical protein
MDAPNQFFSETRTAIGSDDDEFLANALDGMRKCETDWRARGQIFSWIDLKPAWISAADWTDYGGQGHFSPEPTEPCRRILRFTLIGGGKSESTRHGRRGVRSRITKKSSTAV